MTCSLNKLVKMLIILPVLFHIKMASSQKIKNKPNIVFVLIDDLRWDTMGFTGSYPFLKTPNIDKLRSEGVHFENTFCTHSLCAPSRATFLTGTFSQVNGVNTNQEGREFNPNRTPSFPQILQENGYRTAFIGKWHMGNTNKPRKGFDYWCSFKGQGHYYGNDLNINGDVIRNEGYITDQLNNYALDFLKSNPKDQPFCLYLSHKAVHQPFIPASRDKHLYSDALVPEPGNWNDDMTDKPTWQRINPTKEQRHRLRKKELKDVKIIDKRKPRPWPAKSGKGEQKNYLRCISAIDDGLGKIYELLKNEGILDNTIIVFSSDNGFFHGEHGKGDKRLAYNESMRIPLLMRYPKLAKKGGTISDIILNADIAPTFLDLAGIPVPSKMQGKSIVPLLTGTENNWRKSFLFTYWPDLKQFIPRIVAVRTKNYLYSTTPDIDDIEELYDEKNDPYELNNLINNPDYKEVKIRLVKELNSLKEKTLYTADIPRPRPAPKLKVKTGLLYATEFNKQSENQKNIKLIKSQNGKNYGEFFNSSEFTIPYSSDLDPSLGTFIIDCEIKVNTPDGIIASFGDSKDGWALFIEDGRPSFVVAHDHYLQFVDGLDNIVENWYHLTAVIENFKNKISLYGNGRLLNERQMLLPITSNNNGENIVIGKDLPGLIDPSGFSKSTFKGIVKSLKIYRKDLSKSDLNILSSK